MSRLFDWFLIAKTFVDYRSILSGHLEPQECQLSVENRIGAIYENNFHELFIFIKLQQDPCFLIVLCSTCYRLM